MKNKIKIKTKIYTIIEIQTVFNLMWQKQFKSINKILKTHINTKEQISVKLIIYKK